MFKIETFTGKRGGWFGGSLRFNSFDRAKAYMSDFAARERQCEATVMTRRIVPA